MALLGTVGPFDPAVDDWVVYCERLEQFFQANGVAAAEKQRAVLLSVCGSSTYLLIRNLVSPEKPTDKTYAQLVKLVREHVSPPPSCFSTEIPLQLADTEGCRDSDTVRDGVEAPV